MQDIGWGDLHQEAAGVRVHPQEPPRLHNPGQTLPWTRRTLSVPFQAVGLQRDGESVLQEIRIAVLKLH